MDAWMYGSMDACMYEYMNVSMYLSIRTHKYLSVYVSRYSMYVYILVCMYLTIHVGVRLRVGRILCSSKEDIPNLSTVSCTRAEATEQRPHLREQISRNATTNTTISLFPREHGAGLTNSDTQFKSLGFSRILNDRTTISRSPQDSIPYGYCRIPPVLN